MTLVDHFRWRYRVYRKLQGMEPRQAFVATCKELWQHGGVLRQWNSKRGIKWR